jgi:hypothetical protein
MPTFRKLWGVINDDVAEGNYTIQVANLYDVSEWSGEKLIVLATANELGGKTFALGIMCTVGGFIALFAALTIGIVACCMKNTLKKQDLKW